MNDYESSLINLFVKPEKKDRYLLLLTNPKRRSESVRKLVEGRDFKSEIMVPIPARFQTAKDIERLLKEKGARKECYALSENSDLDQKNLPLALALAQAVGFGLGTLLLCFPKKLAYFEAEAAGERYILSIM